MAAEIAGPGQLDMVDMTRRKVGKAMPTGGLLPREE
jgi:hypothetical protein